ncbi:MAG: ribosome silencing factor [Rhodoferax sp.]|uniref:ribosome silencing factor n=1 Tax=Rhodoferax sp. TaxID=50421 RepID=UPI00260C9A82|nr:ribosome silencing factor [Rhodoferax sp.]MDD2879281.1 ribosome silencing factor [Rhodoferax sp.]
MTTKTPAKTSAKTAAKPAIKTTVKPAAKPESTTVAKKDVQKLQRAIVDGLEDVKAQDIVVFDTEHLSSLFERVIVASGTSNRQTKALAASVMDAVREAGFQKPRMEGEANGEWIIVDCGQAVVHVMQPNIRTYYNLEELWGEKPVRLKLGAAKPVASAEAKVVKPVPVAKDAASLRRSSASKKGVEEAFPSRAQMQKAVQAEAAAVKKAAAKSVAKPRSAAPAAGAAPVAKPRIRTLVVNAPGKPAAKKAAAKKAVSKPAVARKAPVRKA